MNYQATVTVFAILVVYSQVNGLPLCGDRELTKDLKRAASRAAEWLSENLIEENTKTEAHILASAFHSLRLVGHPLGKLSNHKTSNMNGDLSMQNTGRIALYVQGFIALCRNPKTRFLRYLKKGIKQHNPSDVTHPFQSMTAVLALCNSGCPFLSNHTVNIVESMLSCRDSRSESIDTVAMTTNALACLADGKYNTKYDIKRKICRETWHETRHNLRNISTYLNRTVTWLLDKQNSGNGNFGGNVVTTALAVQAFFSTNAAPESWRCNKTMRHILKQQQEDGSFGDLMATIQVLPVLRGAVSHDLKRLSCKTKRRKRKQLRRKTVKKTNHVKVEEKSAGVNAIEDDIKKFINVHLLVQFENKTTIHASDVTVVSGSSVHEILQITSNRVNSATTNDGPMQQFYFATSETKYGALVESICGVEEDKVRRQHWLVYTSAMVDGHCLNDGILATVGVDACRLSDDTCVIFEYTEGKSTQSCSREL